MRRELLAEGLGLSGREDRWLRIRDAMTGLEGLRWSAGLVRDGLRVELGAYRCLVLVDLEELADAPDRPVAKLAAELGDGWIPSIDEALAGIALRPVHEQVRKRLAAAVKRPRGATAAPLPANPTKQVEVVARVVEVLDGERFDERRLRPLVGEALRSAGMDGSVAERGADLVRALVIADPGLRRLDDATVAAWFRDAAVRDALYVHDAGGVAWFDRDAFELLVATIARTSGGPDPKRVAALAAAAASAGYKVDVFVAALGRTDGVAGPTRARRPRAKGPAARR